MRVNNPYNKDQGGRHDEIAKDHAHLSDLAQDHRESESFHNVSSEIRRKLRLNTTD